jgi:four helix bundle protein
MGCFFVVLRKGKQQSAISKGQQQKGGAMQSRGAGTPDPFGSAYTFRGLIMWQRAQELADEALDLVATLRNTRPMGVLVQQIVKASTSIGANIAEGHARYSAGAYRNHLSIARGSTAEMVSWLDLLRRRGLLPEDRQQSMLGKCAELMKMLTAKMIELDKQTGTNRSRVLREEGEAYVAD